MQLNKAPYRAIVEVRNAFEPMISQLAAGRMDDDDTRRSRRHHRADARGLEDQHSFLDSNKRFHDIIAWSSGNALFGYIIDSLLGIMDGTAIGIDYPSHRRQAILKAHIEIFEALKARDPKDVRGPYARAHRRLRAVCGPQVPTGPQGDHPLGAALLRLSVRPK